MATELCPDCLYSTDACICGTSAAHEDDAPLDVYDGEYLEDDEDEEEDEDIFEAEIIEEEEEE